MMKVKQILMGLAVFMLVIMSQSLEVAYGQTPKIKEPVLGGLSALDHIAEDIYNIFHANTIEKKNTDLVASPKIIIAESNSGRGKVLITLNQNFRALSGIIKFGYRVFIYCNIS